MSEETPMSVIKKDSLEEKTVFELFYTDECKEPFLEVEYLGIIYLKEGDSVNVSVERKKLGRVVF